MPRLFLVFFILFFTFLARGAEPTGHYKVIVDEMLRLKAAYPTVSHVYSIGENDEGTPIYAMRVSVTPQAVDHKKVGHILVSTHHGNELQAPAFTLLFLKKLLARFGTSDLWRDGLSQTEWTVIPVLNVSGYNAHTRWERNVDPNRDYPGPCNTEGGKLKSIRQLMQLLASRIWVGSVTVHGYQGSLTYPWGMHSDLLKTQDDNLYHQVFTKAAAHNGYLAGNGAQLIYPANGCYEDYVYWKHGSWSLLLELKDRESATTDHELTAQAIFSFYDQLDSSPSNKNQFLGKCSPVSAVMRWE